MANPTTNYGFVLPTPSDLVTDLPADFDVALQGVDTRLKALQPGTTLGDLAYSSATANTNTRLGIGSTGQVLTVSGGVPAWVAPAGGSKVLQVVNATYATYTTTSSITYVDTGLTATITPTSATSKILVFVNQNGCSKTGNLAGRIRLLRNSTALIVLDGLIGYTATAAFNEIGSVSTTYLDNPATTSATTYKTQFASDNGATFDVQNFGGLGNGTTTSTITLMEIGA